MEVHCLQGKMTLRSTVMSNKVSLRSLNGQQIRYRTSKPAGMRRRSQPIVAYAENPVPAPPAPPAPISPLPPPPCLPPAAVYQKVAALGAAKAELSVMKTLVLSLIAGFYISLGGLTMLSVGGASPGVAASNPGLHRLLLGVMGLPIGLLLVLLCGAELFTGNTLMLTVAFFEKKATFAQLIKNWIISYFGNLAGAMLTLKLLALTGLALASPAAVKLATTKTSFTFVEAFTRGILANWMVCLAVWQATAADSIPGKFLPVLMTVTAFVAMGFEHSIANMFMIPLGIASGAPFTFMHFVTTNLIPVSLGNIVGGAVFCAAPYAFVFGGKSSSPKAA